MLPANELISFVTYRGHDQCDAIDATKLATKLDCAGYVRDGDREDRIMVSQSHPLIEAVAGEGLRGDRL
jgi:hypothetical protein